MASIPRFGAQRVAPAPLPGVSVSTSVPAGAFGAQLGAVIDDQIEAERKRVNDAAVNDALGDTRQWVTNSLYNPEVGLFTKTRKDYVVSSVDAPDQMMDFIRGRSDALTPAQRQRYEPLVQDMFNSYQRRVMERAATQTALYEDETRLKLRTSEVTGASFDAGNGSIRLDADGNADTTEVDRALERLALAHAGDFVGQADFAERMEGATARDQELMYGSVLRAVLTPDAETGAINDEVASALFAKWQERLSDSDRNMLEPKVAAASLDGRGRRAGVEILESVESRPWSAAPSPEQINRAAREQLADVDEEIRPAASATITKRVDALKGRETAARAEAQQNVDGMLEAGRTIEEIEATPAFQWVLTKSARDAVRADYNRRQRGAQVVTPSATFATLTDEAINAPEKLVKRNLTQMAWEGKLSREDAALFGSIGAGGDGPYEGFLTISGQVNAAARRYSSNKEKQDAFIDVVNRGLIQMGAAPGAKPPTPEDAQKLADAYLADAEFGVNFGLPFFGADVERVFGEIPEDVLVDLTGELARSGKPVTAQNLADAYQRFLEDEP